jgi:hypothetical protein
MSDDNHNALPAPAGRGPGRPFAKGNSGRKPGPNKRTMFLAAIGKGNADDIVKKTVQLAREGKQWACEAVLARLYPPAKDRAVTFPMAEIRSIEDIEKAYAGLWAACSQGLLTPAEAVALSGMLRDHATILEASEIERRLKALEDAEQRRAA